jgi:hypothetical protein
VYRPGPRFTDPVHGPGTYSGADSGTDAGTHTDADPGPYSGTESSHHSGGYSQAGFGLGTAAGLYVVGWSRRSSFWFVELSQ